MQAFESKEQAREYLETCGLNKLDHRTYEPTGTYYLSHGEMNRPDIKIIKYSNGWGFYYRSYFFVGTFVRDFEKRQRCNVYEHGDIVTAARWAVNAY